MQLGDKAKALLQVAVSFEPGGVTFTPNEAAVLDVINANTLEGILAVTQVCVCVCVGDRHPW